MALINIDNYTNVNSPFSKGEASRLKSKLVDVFLSVVANRSFLILIISLFLLSLGFKPEWQNIIGKVLFLIGLVTVGIPHGAVDHLYESGTFFSKRTISFILNYVFLSFAMGLFWFISPKLALCLFLFYSAWHFGQSDGEQWNFSHWFSYLWGCVVIFYLLGTHYYETNEILKSISGVEMPFGCSVWFIIPFMLAAIYYRSYTFAITICWLIVATQLPLLIAFGLYFIGQHSLSNWKNISQKLQMPHYKIWLHALPFHVGAWFIFLLFLYAWPILKISNDYNRWGIFFVFIACISLPHVITIHLFKNKSISN